MFSLDYQSKISIYEQIVNNIEKYVALGILKSKEQIPSIRDLASTLSINPNTVKKAYDILEKKGVIVTISTKGTFITENTHNVLNSKIEQSIMEISNLIDELTKLGISKEDILKKL